MFKWTIDGDVTVNLEGPYTLATVIDGEGEMQVDGTHYSLEKGRSFILPAGIDSLDLAGEMTLISSYPNHS